MCSGARVTYSSGRAVYEGQAATLSLRLEVSVPAEGCAKRLKLELIQQGEEEKNVEIAYYTEPVLGVDRRGAAGCNPIGRTAGCLSPTPFRAISPAA